MPSAEYLVGFRTMKRVLVMSGYACNNNCVFCSADSYNNRAVNRSSTELAADIIANSRHCSGIVLIGGEFTIRKDAVKLVSLCRACGYKEISIETNGRMFANRDFCGSIIGAGLNEISFSIHGAAAGTHDAITRSKGSFAQAIQGLENAGRHTAAINVVFVAMAENISELPAFMRMMAAYDFVDRVVVHFVRPPVWIKDDRRLLKMVPRYTEAEKVFRAVSALGRAQFQYFPSCLAKGLSLVPQQDKRKTFNLSVQEERREDLYSSLMSEFMFPPECSGCKLRKGCGGITRGYYRLYGAGELRPPGGV